MPKEKLITILGPTASGKTALGVYLAKALGSVVISGDAFQVYRRMDIGTAKVTKEEAEGVPHFLVDCLEPTESYSAADFQEKAKAIIHEENEKGRIPIVVGGTGLYIQSLLEGYEFLPKVGGREPLGASPCRRGEGSAHRRASKAGRRRADRPAAHGEKARASLFRKQG